MKRVRTRALFTYLSSSIALLLFLYYCRCCCAVIDIDIVFDVVHVVVNVLVVLINVRYPFFSIFRRFSFVGSILVVSIVMVMASTYHHRHLYQDFAHREDDEASRLLAASPSFFSLEVSWWPYIILTSITTVVIMQPTCVVSHCFTLPVVARLVRGLRVGCCVNSGSCLGFLLRVVFSNPYTRQFSPQSTKVRMGYEVRIPNLHGQEFTRNFLVHR